MPIITKSKFMNGEKCSRLLWFANQKQIPKPNISDKHKFQQGYDFEEYVKKLFPEGVECSNKDFKTNIDLTTKAIINQDIIFEAGILSGNFYIRADILQPQPDGWNLYEIKSTTQAKIHHIPDLAYQKFVCERYGLKIKKCFVIFINKEYTKKGNINYNELTMLEDVTDKVNKIENLEEKANNYLKIIKMDKPAEIIKSISKNCNSPYVCPLKSDCWGTLPENNVLQLTNWRMYWDLFEEGKENGKLDINDLDESLEFKPKDKILIEAVKDNKIKIQKPNLKLFLDSLTYPLYHFDFETFDTVIPIYDKTRPYQKIPFQYSLHIQHQNGRIEHYEYLADGNSDPRIELLKTLKPIIEGKGDVIVYNKSFEKSVLEKLAIDFPENMEWIQDVINRLKDLANPFRNFDYYNPSQKGSYSIKKILPAITGKSYSDLEINNGAIASIKYFNSHINSKTMVDYISDKEEIRENLLKYCGLDTEGMIWIVNEMGKLVESN